MTRSLQAKGLAEMLGFVVIFMLVVMMSIYFFSLNALADNTQNVNIEKDMTYKAEKIRIRTSVTRIMVDKLWRAENVNYGEYQNKKGYTVISKFLSSDPGEKIWLNGTDVSYSNTETDLRDYITTVMDNSYGNKPYKVELADQTGTVLTVGSISGASRVSYPIALQSGEGRITVYVESGDVLNVR